MLRDFSLSQVLILSFTMSSIAMFAPAFKPSQTKHVKEISQSRTKKRKRGLYNDASGVRLDVLDVDEPSSIFRKPVDGYVPGSDQSEDDTIEHRNGSAGGSAGEAEYGNPSSLRSRSSDATGLRKQHLAILVAVLHKCLLAGDYLRAGRAWGMLLRAELDGHSMDVRAYGRWGIGAEILLFRDTQLAQRQQNPEDDEEGAPDDQFADGQEKRLEHSIPLFSHEGFNKARDYYERLILQYPYRKVIPNAISSLDFYPAMFGLWVYAVQHKHKSMLNDSEANHSLSESHSTNGNGEMRLEVEHATFQSSSEIATQMDELLVSPPYSDNLQLWRLRGMVAMWMADLRRSDTSSDSIPDSEVSSIDLELSRGDHNLRQYQLDTGTRQEQRLKAQSKAREAFQNVSRLESVSF